MTNIPFSYIALALLVLIAFTFFLIRRRKEEKQLNDFLKEVSLSVGFAETLIAFVKALKKQAEFSGKNTVGKYIAITKHCYDRVIIELDRLELFGIQSGTRNIELYSTFSLYPQWKKILKEFWEVDKKHQYRLKDKYRTFFLSNKLSINNILNKLIYPKAYLLLEKQISNIKDIYQLNEFLVAHLPTSIEYSNWAEESSLGYNFYDSILSFSERLVKNDSKRIKRLILDEVNRIEHSNEDIAKQQERLYGLIKMYVVNLYCFEKVLKSIQEKNDLLLEKILEQETGLENITKFIDQFSSPKRKAKYSKGFKNIGV